MVNVKNIVAFCALMENHGGIIDKSPDYIVEKFMRYCTSPEDESGWGLDEVRQAIVKEWENRWVTPPKPAIPPEEEKFQ